MMVCAKRIHIFIIKVNKVFPFSRRGVSYFLNVFQFKKNVLSRTSSYYIYLIIRQFREVEISRLDLFVYVRTRFIAKGPVSPFARPRNICCGHKFCVWDTKNVSDLVQKHFVSATNVSQFAQPKKHHGQQCVFVCQGLKFRNVYSKQTRITSRFLKILTACIKVCQRLSNDFKVAFNVKATRVGEMSALIIHCGPGARFSKDPLS